MPAKKAACDPGSRWEENAEAGAIVRVPLGIAIRMVLAGDTG